MTKTELHKLVDALPDESPPAAAILLRRAQDPVMAKLDAAPLDDEELTDEELTDEELTDEELTDEELTDEDLRAIKDARSEPALSWSDAEAELNAG